MKRVPLTLPLSPEGEGKGEGGKCIGDYGFQRRSKIHLNQDR